MQLYETRLTWGAAGSWHGDRALAHDKAKTTPVREAARVYLWDVPTGKGAMLAALNGAPLSGAPLLAAWTLSKRMGLQPLDTEVALRELADDEPAAPEPVAAPSRRDHPRAGTQAAAETNDAFWARLEAEEADRKGAKPGGRKPPTDEELDQL